MEAFMSPFSFIIFRNYLFICAPETPPIQYAIATIVSPKANAIYFFIN